MRFISTRGKATTHTFSEAVEAGLAPDGGLFLPDLMPDISGRLAAWEPLSYPDLAAEFLALFAPEIPPAEWHDMTRAAYARFSHPDIAPLVRLDERTFVLE